MRKNVFTIGQLPNLRRGESRLRPRTGNAGRGFVHKRQRALCSCGFHIRGEHHNDGGHHKGQKFGN